MRPLRGLIPKLLTPWSYIDPEWTIRSTKFMMNSREAIRRKGLKFPAILQLIDQTWIRVHLYKQTFLTSVTLSLLLSSFILCLLTLSFFCWGSFANEPNLFNKRKRFRFHARQVDTELLLCNCIKLYIQVSLFYDSWLSD